ncbi:MAG: hypothetical protein OXE74_04850 [Cyanobacteria bacterium MAG CAR2_bin_4]|nr:hypothetical protein [Cyanobacteria bacterium MAG CAR2_bin_4]
MHILAFQIGVDYGAHIVFVFVMIPFAPSHRKLSNGSLLRMFPVAPINFLLAPRAKSPHEIEATELTGQNIYDKWTMIHYQCQEIRKRMILLILEKNRLSRKV